MIIGLFTGLGSIGGVQIAGRQTAAVLANAGRERGWPCVFFSLNDDPGEQQASAAGTQFVFRGFGRNKVQFTLQVISLARRRPQLIFAAHPNLAPVALLLRTVAGGVPLIVCAHGIEVWRPLPAMRRHALSRADLVIVPSSYTMRRTAEVQGVSASKIAKVPWALDTDLLRLSELPEPLPRDFPGGQVVLSVGRWTVEERYKGADLLIRAVSQLSHHFPTLQLVMVGSGDDVPRLKQEARNYGVSGRIHFFTAVSRSELAGFYLNADIFALPSTGEGFGLVFLEAMAFGKPVIAANAGGVPDVVEHGRDGLLIEPTAEAVSAALGRLLSNPALRKEFGAHGQKRVQSEFSFSSFEKRLSDTIDHLFTQFAERN